MAKAQASGLRTVSVRIEGRVQGVGFRYWVERTATGLGLKGWVRNRRDGGVEAVFSGLAGDVTVMIERSHAGPASARVDLLHVVEEEGPVPDGFEVRPTV